MVGESNSVPTQTYFRWLTTENTSAFAALESRNAKKKMTIFFFIAPLNFALLRRCVNALKKVNNLFSLEGVEWFKIW